MPTGVPTKGEPTEEDFRDVYAWSYVFLRYKEAKNMELMAATKIVQALYLGKSPETDKPLPPGSICLQEDVKAALEVALERLTWPVNQKAREQSVPNQGKPWSPGEDAQLAREFDQSLSEREMAQAHGRSQWAINRRLERLGKIPASQPAVQRAS
jgi:hypothetical protein